MGPIAKYDAPRMGFPAGRLNEILLPIRHFS
jgi:hypothetical protein